MLLGMLVDADSRANIIFGLQELLKDDAIRQASLPKYASPKDIPLAGEMKRILVYTAEEATRLNDYWIDTDHIVLGILREKDCKAANMLIEKGVDLEVARARVLQNRRSRPFYGRVPLLWALEKPINRLSGVLYLLVVLLLLNLFTARFCTSSAPIR